MELQAVGMFDIDDDAKGDFGQVDRLTGSAGRRLWSAEERAVIVAESEVAGKRVSDVARRWRLRPQQGFHAQTLENFDPMGLSDLPVKGPQSVFPEVVEAIGGELSVEHGVLDVFVPEIVLDGTGVLAVIGEFEAD